MSARPGRKDHKSGSSFARPIVVDDEDDKEVWIPSSVPKSGKRMFTSPRYQNQKQRANPRPDKDIIIIEDDDDESATSAGSATRNRVFGPSKLAFRGGPQQPETRTSPRRQRPPFSSARPSSASDVEGSRKAAGARATPQGENALRSEHPPGTIGSDTSNSGGGRTSSRLHHSPLTPHRSPFALIPPILDAHIDRPRTQTTLGPRQKAPSFSPRADRVNASSPPRYRVNNYSRSAPFAPSMSTLSASSIGPPASETGSAHELTGRGRPDSRMIHSSPQTQPLGTLHSEQPAVALVPNRDNEQKQRASPKGAVAQPESPPRNALDARPGDLERSEHAKLESTPHIIKEAVDEDLPDAGLPSHADNPQLSSHNIDPPLLSIEPANIETSIAKIQACMTTSLEGYHSRHALTLASLLRRQRAVLSREAHAKKSEVAEPRGPSTFANMKPINTRKVHGSRDAKMEKLTKNKKATGPAKYEFKLISDVPLTTYKAPPVDVPSFQEYLTLRNNFIAENNKVLRYWPYVDDEEGTTEKASLSADLHVEYAVDEDAFGRVLRAEQYRAYAPCAEAVLSQVGIQFQDILFWLLCQQHTINFVPTSDEWDDRDLSAALAARDSYCPDDLDRRHQNWTHLLLQLPIPSRNRLRLSAVICSMFHKKFGLSIWRVASRSKAARDILFKSTRATTNDRILNFQYRKGTCRICHEYNCLYHGIMEDEPNIAEKHSNHSKAVTKGDDTGTTQDMTPPPEQDVANKGDKLDMSYPKNEYAVSHRRVITMPLVRQTEPDDSLESQPGKFNARIWFQKGKVPRIDKREPFFPCSHEGSCKDAQCSCFRAGVLCEKTCGCLSTCKLRYPGCTCRKAMGTESPPCSTTRCECKLLNRECDADLCGGCGSDEILDPVNRYNDRVREGACRNVQIQRAVPARTLLGKSTVHGFGLYAGQNLKAGDLIGEYLGELLGPVEKERRAVIYYHLKTTYTFGLDLGQDVDSTHVGNKLRFINDAPPAIANLYPKIVYCNGIVRIGLFAKKNLPTGTELFFHYRYPEEVVKNFAIPGAEGGIAQEQATVGATASRKMPSNKRMKIEYQKNATSEDRRAHTEKAREARWAKRNTETNGAQQDPPRRQGMQHAVRKMGVPDVKSLKSKSARGRFSPPGGQGLGGLSPIAPTHAIDDTDEEDEDFRMADAEDADDDDDDDDDDGEDDIHEVPISEGAESKPDLQSDDEELQGTHMRSSIRGAMSRRNQRIRIQREQTVDPEAAGRILRRNLQELRSGRGAAGGSNQPTPASMGPPPVPNLARKRKRVIMDDEDEDE
ncbi:hypothetical protein EJ04DRAFT_459454 [Polyplosphaeria fusca]|uniref:Uncharacterized protein n=1 Tax=Polyplosphaeria fusca TaxID=682080 RepID=A0A9P4R312_9PLEO|nr:hypothetical protein EJ04DRAFT_459454 [Polyplosphaeria fusca]